VKLALENVAQVAGGLAAVQKQKLVHRDIKTKQHHGQLRGRRRCDRENHRPPKADSEPSNQTAISMPGLLWEPPGYASSEQFTGVQVDVFPIEAGNKGDSGSFSKLVALNKLGRTLV
jgi:hypothetical protein